MAYTELERSDMGRLRIMLRAFGTHGSGEAIYFCARKLNGPDDALAAWEQCPHSRTLLASLRGARFGVIE